MERTFNQASFVKQLPILIRIGIIPFDLLRENGICNGCSFVPDRWLSTGYIGLIGDAHDICYFIGGTEEDKNFIDEGFHQAIIQHGREMGCWLTRPIHIFLSKRIARIYCKGVRLFGSKFFKYKKESILSHEQIRELFKIALSQSKGMRLIG